MTRLKIDVYGLLSFRQVGPEFTIPVCAMSALELVKKFKQEGVSLFSSTIFADPGRMFTVTSGSARVAIVEVTAPRPCFFGTEFMERAKLSGFNYLQADVGPYIALSYAYKFSPVTVASLPFPSTVNSNDPAHLLWKISRIGDAKPNLMAIEANPRIEGVRYIACLPCPN